MTGVAILGVRPFAYTRRELEVFLAGGPLESVHVEREPASTPLLGLFFVRIRLMRPSES